jgi:hypothetical protein
VLNKKKYQYHDVGLNPAIQNAAQALAIDERRKPFAPDVWTKPVGWDGKLDQAWFPGVHSNIGGGYAPDGLANEPLHWIIGHAEQLGLEVDTAYLAHFLPCFNSVLNDSMTITYKVMGENVRRLGQHANDGEALHRSAIDRKNLLACAYDPPNLDLNLPVVDTTRLPRGQPCPERP